MALAGAAPPGRSCSCRRGSACAAAPPGGWAARGSACARGRPWPCASAAPRARGGSALTALRDEPMDPPRSPRRGETAALRGRPG
eukprot:10570927-Lingulodinium_polyedra.AAC.1